MEGKRDAMVVSSYRLEVRKDVQPLLESALDSAWKELGPSDLDRIRAVTSGGATPSRDTLIDVKYDASGFSPEVVGVLIVLAPAAKMVLEDIWKRILLPRLEKRFGPGAIKQTEIEVKKSQ